MRRTSISCWPLAALLALAACNGMFAEQATTGALSAATVKAEQLDPSVASPLAQRTARGVVAGTLSQLEAGEQRELLHELIASTAAAAVGGIASRDSVALGQIANVATANAIAALTRELEADGALRGSMISAAREISAASVAGAREELRGMFPACPTDEPNCVERRIVDISRSVSRGVAKGVFDAFHLGALALAFIGGVLITLLAVAVVRVVRPAHGP